MRLVRAPEWIEDGGMRRLVASLCVCWAATCTYPPNTAPLAFGMTVEQASVALGVPLIRHSGRGGSAVYVAGGTAALGYYPVDVGIALQFRNGQLTGWKKDWRVMRPGPF